MFLILGYTTTLSLCPYNFFVHQLLYQSLNKPKQKKKHSLKISGGATYWIKYRGEISPGACAAWHGQTAAQPLIDPSTVCTGMFSHGEDPTKASMYESALLPCITTSFTYSHISCTQLAMHALFIVNFCSFSTV